METELAAFEERFGVCAHDPLDAMCIMTPQMIEGIYFLDQKLDVPLAFSFKNGEMFVFMALTRDAFDVSGEKTLLEERELLERQHLKRNPPAVIPPDCLCPADFHALT